MTALDTARTIVADNIKAGVPRSITVEKERAALDAILDAVAASDGQLATHTAAADPHPQYADDASLGALANTVSAHTGSTTNPHAVTKAQVGLGNVPNTDATARANHTGTQSASTITGLATVATSGAYADLTGKPATTGTHAILYASLTAAITAAGALGTVFLPPGTVDLPAAGLTISGQPVKLQGSSQGGTTLRLSATGTTSITLEEGTGGGTVAVNIMAGGCELSDLTIDANGNTTFAALVTGQTLDGLTLTRVTCKGAKYGTFFQSTSNLRAVNCKFTGNSLHQAFYQSVRTASNVIITGCTFDPAGANSGATVASTGFWLQARVGSTGTYAGSSGAVSNFVFANNNLPYVGLAAVEADGFVATADSTSTIRNLCVFGNTVTMTGTSTVAWGMEFGGAVTYSCTGNTITMNGGNGAIWANTNGSSGTSARAAISGNTLRSTNGTGVAITCSAGSAAISGNTCVGWLWSVSSATDLVTITGNIFEHIGIGNCRGVNWSVAGGNGGVISGNTFINATYAMSVTSANVANLNISGNHFVAANSGSYGVIFWSATSGSGNVINGNTFAGYTAANKYYQIGGFASVTDNTPMTFASLPAGAAGSQCTITDCNTSTPGASAAGGGSTKALVWHNGTAWKVVAA